VERAKGILIKHTGLSEPDAFRRLQKMASSKSVKMAVLARSIITAEETFAETLPSDTTKLGQSSKSRVTLSQCSAIASQLCGTSTMSLCGE
jgi:hypothetical protein